MFEVEASVPEYEEVQPVKKESSSGFKQKNITLTNSILEFFFNSEYLMKIRGFYHQKGCNFQLSRQFLK